MRPITEPDPTMRSLLEVHRAELNSRDEDLDNLGSQLEYQLGRNSEVDNKRAHAEVEKGREKKRANDAEEHVKKLQGVIETLKIELANARAEAEAAKNGETPGATTGGVA